MQMRLNFFFSVSDRTLTFKNEHCRGGKNSNERITVMLAANMKLKLNL